MTCASGSGFHAMRRLLAVLLVWACAGASGSTLCQSGRRQSPIDIRSGATVRQALPPLNVDYHAAPLKLADDGHTVRVRFGNGSALQIGEQRYTLQQFHFHTPGGDRISGEEFPMAAHLLHKSTTGQLLAVVVLFRLGAENPLLASLLPLIPARADGDHSPPGATINAASLLPVQRGYYRYAGSIDGDTLHRGRGLDRPEAAAGALPRAAGALPAALCRQCPGGAAAARTRGARKSLRPAMRVALLQVKAFSHAMSNNPACGAGMSPGAQEFVCA